MRLKLVALPALALMILSGPSLPTIGSPVAIAGPIRAVQPVPTGPVAQPLAADDSDHTFGIAVLPDTQRETHTAKDRRLEQRSEYLAAHQKSWDLRFALHVGDVVDWDTSDHGMYHNAASSLLPLEASMPWATAVGNHDTAAVCPGGSACPGTPTSRSVRDTEVFNTYFPSNRFSALQGEFETGKIDNAYHTFRAGGVEWLVLNLELWPRMSVISWANNVVKAHPDKNVIILTHSYLTAAGKISSSNGGYGATSPKYLFDHLVKRYPNIKFVFSGHVGKAKTRTDKGVKGNKIVSYLQCFHSDDSNPVRTLSIHTRTGRVYSDIHWPSTGKKDKTRKVTNMRFVRPKE